MLIFQVMAQILSRIVKIMPARHEESITESRQFLSPVLLWYYNSMPKFNNPKLQSLYDDLLNLTISPLYNYRTENKYFPVLGEGNENATIIFIGEAPGKKEAETGRPFVGAAGRVLDELLQGIGLKREDVFISTIVNDRPPENRDPLPAAIK